MYTLRNKYDKWKKIATKKNDVHECDFVKMVWYMSGEYKNSWRVYDVFYGEFISSNMDDFACSNIWQ